MWKGFKEFLTYTRKQRNGLLALLLVAVLIQLLLYFDDFLLQTDPQGFSEFKAYAEEWHRKDSLKRINSSEASELFPFNPNTAHDSTLQKLGFPEWLSQRLIRYRKSGGEFREPSDLGKLYGMDSTLYDRLLPYVRIPEQAPTKDVKEDPFQFEAFDPNTVSAAELQEMGLYDWQAERIKDYRDKVRPFHQPEELYKVYGLDSFIVEKMLPHARVDSSNIHEEDKTKKQEPVMVNINRADSVKLLELNGVGPFYSKMIRRYRDRLGGFYRPEQLLEVYDMEQKRLDQFKEQLIFDEEVIRKLNVNKASFKELLRHPYLEYEVVKNIVNFREGVRPFKSLDELKKLELIDEQLFSKIAEYLTIEHAE